MGKFEVKAREDGPYLVSGSATYVDADGQEQAAPGRMVALCRCGGSANKPFCDGTHRKIKFKAPAIDLQMSTE